MKRYVVSFFFLANAATAWNGCGKSNGPDRTGDLAGAECSGSACSEDAAIGSDAGWGDVEADSSVSDVGPKPDVPGGCEAVGMYDCGDGQCFDEAGVCDGKEDCANGADEGVRFGCGQPTCEEQGLWDCGDGQCIPSPYFCDGVLDCTNGADEAPGRGCEGPSCESSGLFDCGDGSCAFPDWVCDGIAQCADGSDESADAGCQDVCNGCFGSFGECSAGTSEDACGKGGVACVQCKPDEQCEDGECSVPSACGPAICGGCCDGDLCVSGESDQQACGMGGAQCQKCSAGGNCVAGSCVPPCNLDTCAGCCKAGTCVEGDLNSQCGTGGEPCTSCGAGSMCKSGTCIGIDCAGSCAGCCLGNECMSGAEDSACGSQGEPCKACGPFGYCKTYMTDVEFHWCAADPAYEWDVVLLSAEVPVTDSGDESWDAWGGLPDVYARVFNVSQSGTVWQGFSETMDDTTSPTWNETVLQGIGTDEFFALKFELWDDDLLGGDWIGLCPSGLFKGAEVKFDGSTLECAVEENPGQGDLVGFKVTYKIVPHQ